MQAHMVTCFDCGIRFDANNGAYYIQSSRRYVCPNCGMRKEGQPGIIKHNPVRADLNDRYQSIEQRAAHDGVHKPTTGGIIWKIAIGALFLATAFTAEMSNGGKIAGIIIGIAFIIWAIIPYLKYRSWYKKEMQEEEDIRLAHILQQPLNTYGNAELDDLQKKYDSMGSTGKKLPDQSP